MYSVCLAIFMTVSVRSFVKAPVGAAVAAVNPQCRFDRAIFVMSHMRGATTALSNVLCSHPQISGYGEAHISYQGRGSLGQLAVNQARRSAWSPSARYLFDKMLHNRLDRDLPEAFFAARVVFLLRAPEPTIPSVANLFQHVGSSEYPDETTAAQYYLARVRRLTRLWPRFAPEWRIGLRSEALLSDPEAAVARIQGMLQMSPPLQNRYVSRAASIGAGAGDPIQSGNHARIERRAAQEDVPVPHIAPSLLVQCRKAYEALLQMMEEG